MVGVSVGVLVVVLVGVIVGVNVGEFVWVAVAVIVGGTVIKHVEPGIENFSTRLSPVSVAYKLPQISKAMP